MPPPGSRGAKAAAAMRRRSEGDHTTLGRRIALAAVVALGASISVVGARRLYLNARAAEPFDKMLDWFGRECSGGYVAPGLSRQPDGFRGIVLPNPVKQGDTVLSVPRKCAFLTSDAAQLLRDDGLRRRGRGVAGAGALRATARDGGPDAADDDVPGPGRGALAAAKFPPQTPRSP